MPRLVVSVLLLLTVGWGVAAQDLDKARLFYTNKMFDEAKREAIAVVFSDASHEKKADALNLLGTIAVDQGDYDTAIKNWTELSLKYPGTTAAKEAEIKLPLVKKLAVVAQGETTASEAEEEGAVLVAGSAPEHPQYADAAVLEFMNFLTSRGVKTINFFAGRLSDATQGRVAQVSLPNLLSRARETKAVSALYVYIHFKGMENMRVECYAPDGKKLWQEKVAASFGISPSGMTEGFVRRMKGKLEKRIGGPCFPVQTQGGR